MKPHHFINSPWKLRQEEKKAKKKTEAESLFTMANCCFIFVKTVLNWTLRQDSSTLLMSFSLFPKEAHENTSFSDPKLTFKFLGIKCSQFLSRTRFGLWCLWFWKIINGAFSSFQERWSLQRVYLSYLHNLLIFSAAETTSHFSNSPEAVFAKKC